MIERIYIFASRALSVHLYGVGRRTIDKIRAFDLGIIDSLTHEIVLPEIGTNDHANSTPEVRSSVLDDLVQFSSSPAAVHVGGWCYGVMIITQLNI